MFKSLTLLLLLATSQAAKIRSTTKQTCNWVYTNGNTDGETYIGYAASASDCLAKVMDQCPWAEVANISNGHGDGQEDCWCQNAFSEPADHDYSYQSCFVAGAVDDLDIDFDATTGTDTFDVCSCSNLPNTGACGDACQWGNAETEAECMNMGYASCAAYCFEGDMGGKCV